MSQEHLRGFLHESPGKGIALIRPKIMPLRPAPANELLKIRTRIDILVIGREVVQDLRRSMNASRRLACTVLRWGVRGMFRARRCVTN